jgi:hypothetical protein
MSSSIAFKIFAWFTGSVMPSIAVDRALRGGFGVLQHPATAGGCQHDHEHA